MGRRLWLRPLVREADRRGGCQRKPLYWVDPMHPWYKSDRPGIAPDCGMKLVAVYPGDEAKYQERSAGMVQITPRAAAVDRRHLRSRRI